MAVLSLIPAGSLYRMKGSIICMSFLDFKGSLIHSVSEQWKDNRDNRDCSERVVSKTTSSKYSLFSYMFGKRTLDILKI